MNLFIDRSAQPRCINLGERSALINAFSHSLGRERTLVKLDDGACVAGPEGAARAVASALVAQIRGVGEATLYHGAGTCYIEFGAGPVGRVDVDFFSGPKPTGRYHESDLATRAHKQHFGASREARWFGM